MVVRKSSASDVAPSPDGPGQLSASPEVHLPYPVTPTSPQRANPFKAGVETPPSDESTADANPASSSHQDGEPLDRLPATLRVGSGRLDREPVREAPGLPASLRVGSPAASPRSSQEASRPTTAVSQASVTLGQATPLSTAHVQPQATPHHPDQGAGGDPDIEDDFLGWRTKREASRAHAQDYLTPTTTANPFADDAFPQTAPSTRREETDKEVVAPEKEVVVPEKEVVAAEKEVQAEPSDVHTAATSGPLDWYGEVPQNLVPVTPEPRRTGVPESASSEYTPQTAGSAVWDPGADISTYDAFTSRSHGLPDVGEEDEAQPQPRSWQEQKEWEQAERERKEADLVKAMERAQIAELERAAEEEWHRGEQEALRAAEARQAGPSGRGTDDSTVSRGRQEVGVAPGPAGASADAAPSSSSSTAAGKKKQTSETYQIKHITWVDPSSPQPRQSPILVQNANGPCPLLALVNALTLSTARGEKTALTETLRVREQVSLGLLLDAVFDELTSGRRGDASHVLPDVSDLYAFLLTLHAGMNVNPRFFRAGPDPAPGASPFGSFEETREMRLYSTFSVPLIHGWLPTPGSLPHAALERAAQTYEDAQNLLFRDEELREKLQRDGLGDQELLLLQDVSTVNSFLDQSATQLTAHGLETIIDGMQPGSIAILFRNDHFSTLYKHPQSNGLLQLVTDMGYAGHQEVVWESLVDVTGERSDFFAGDFRPVGVSHRGDDVRPRDGHGGGGGGDEAERRRTRRGPADGPGPSGGNNPAAVGAEEEKSKEPSTTEQEDHDLALALQLQEEEEDRHHREMAARRHENDLSQDYLSGQEAPSSSRNDHSVRVGSLDRGRDAAIAHGQNVRPLVPPRGQHQPPRSGGGKTRRTADGDSAPPSYEQAAHTTPYYPPPNDPAFAGAPPPRPGRGGGPAGPGGGRPPAPGSPRAHSMRAQAARLIDEVSAASGPGQGHGHAHAHGPPRPGHAPYNAPGSGVRRRQSSGPAYGGQRTDVGDSRKDCIMM